ncbi:MAG: DEAD/DEAH box helicase [Ilumatobacteraceae bacterium]
MHSTLSNPRVDGAPTADFAGFGLPRPLVDALTSAGLTTPRPIQTATLPDSLAGRDVIGRGRTGSGKTLAFALPVVAAVAATRDRRKARHPRGLVLVPTRELAAQVMATIAPLGRALGVEVATVFGGVGAGPQISALTRGVDIVVACPGRLEDLIGQGHCRLDNVVITVLDEADHMADLGFLPGVKRILDATPRRSQRLLFSATLDNGVDVLVQRYLHQPTTHSVDPVESPVPDMTHHVFHVTSGDKPAIVRELGAGRERVLMFTRTKHGAKRLAQQMTRTGIHTVELHGNLSQSARTHNLHLFSTGEARVLIATDIAARGIHVDDIALVVHVDPPAEHKAFLHRSGRTARSGAAGTVITLSTPEQRRDVAGLARAARIAPITTEVRPGHPLIGELTGPPAPPSRRPATPAPVAAAAKSGPRPGGAHPRPAGAGRPRRRRTTR